MNDEGAAGATMSALLQRHRSIRRYDAERPLEPALVEQVLTDAFAGSSSSGNLNMSSVVLTRDPERKRRLYELHFEQPMVLEAPLVLQAPSDLGLDTARQFGRTLSLRTDLVGHTAAPGLHAFIIGDGFSHDVPISQTNEAFDVDGVGVTAGVETGLLAGVAGVAVNYSRPRVRFGNDSFRENADSYQIGAYAGSAFGPIFAQAHIGYGKDKHKLTRTGVVEAMTAKPDGSHVLAGAKVGYSMPMGPVSISPVVALDYAKAKVDGYTEKGDPALTLHVDSQSYEALTGNVGLELRGSAGVPGVGIRPFASALLEKDLIGDGRVLNYAQTDASVIVNTFDYPDRSTKMYGRLTGGASASVLGMLDLEAAVSGTVGKKQGNELSAHVGFRLGF